MEMDIIYYYYAFRHRSRSSSSRRAVKSYKFRELADVGDFIIELILLLYNIIVFSTTDERKLFTGHRIRQTFPPINSCTHRGVQYYVHI